MTLADLNRRKHAALLGLFDDFTGQLILAVSAPLLTTAPTEESTDPTLTGAVAAWDVFAADLRAHAAFEEKEVLPLARQAGVPPKGDPRLIHHDHELIEQCFGNIEALLRGLSEAPVNDRLRLLVRGLSVLARFADLFEHHTVRECDFLYPALGGLDETARARLTGMLR